MIRPKALIVWGDGLNCENETAWAFELAGAEAQKVHVNDLLEKPEFLHQSQIFVIPGGFSFGDQLRSGRVLALKFKERLLPELEKFIEQGKLVLGICNGFQVLMQLGVFSEGERKMTLMNNTDQKFIDRWVKLKVQGDSAWLKGLNDLEMPVRHGEGKIYTEDGNLNPALSYTKEINGSYQQLAGLTDKTGHVLGLMPHPEAFVSTHQYYQERYEGVPSGLLLLKSGVDYVKQM